MNLKARALERLFSSCAFLFFLSACVGSPPVEEFNLARAAREAAVDSESSRYAQGLWYKAEESYKEAIRLYKDRKYDDARTEFNAARELLERAENAARLSRVQSGGVPQ